MPLTILSTDLEIQTALKNVLKSGRRFPVDIFLALTKEDIPNTWRKFGAGNNLSIVEGVLEANGSMSRLAETFARAIDGEYSDYVRLVRETLTKEESRIIESEEWQTRLSESWKKSYYGDAAKGLSLYLNRCNRLFREESGQPYYAKFLSVIQSSGTGKSRTIIQLGKEGKIIVLYFNFRPSADTKNYPPRDDFIADFLGNGSSLPRPEYEERCHWFFGATFKVLSLTLSSSVEATAGVYEDAVQHWNEHYGVGGTERATFLSSIERNIREQQIADLMPYDGLMGRSSSETRSRQWMDDMYAQLATEHKTIFPENKDDPQIVIALDEAHDLGMVSSIKNKNDHIPSVTLCRVIKRFSTQFRAVWVIFASTTSRISDFATPSSIYPSLRVAVEGQLLFKPFTFLGWDSLAYSPTRLVTGSNSSIDKLIRFGRPLWLSLLSKSGTMAYEQLITVVRQKLLLAQTFDPKSKDQVLAVLGQRFILDICLGHVNAIATLDTAVSSHLRYCIETTDDRSWSFTRYPSEPFLSHVAADTLHGASSPQSICGTALQTLRDIVVSGLVEKGLRGELVCRLLLLLSKDVMGTRRALSDSNSDLFFCRSVPLLHWMESIFGDFREHIYPPTDRDAVYSKIKEDFAGATVNLSHFIAMDSNITDSEDQNWNTGHWLSRMWMRTAGVQLALNQPLFDQVIPVRILPPDYKEDMETSLSDFEQQMSGVYISNRARNSGTRADLSKMTTNHDDVRCQQGLPEVIIHIDIGVQEDSRTDKRITYPIRGTSKTLRIYAKGLNKEVFPFLALPCITGVEAALQDILRAQVPSTAPELVALRNAPLFGSKSGSDWKSYENEVMF